jgi:hypothetical protein
MGYRVAQKELTRSFLEQGGISGAKAPPVFLVTLPIPSPCQLIVEPQLGVALIANPDAVMDKLVAVATKRPQVFLYLPPDSGVRQVASTGPKAKHSLQRFLRSRFLRNLLRFFFQVSEFR